MKRLVFALLICFAWVIPAHASLTSVYIGQSAAGSGAGTSCATQKAATFFNSSSNWGAGSTQIGPGTTVNLCGTITTALTAYGSGTAGNTITIQWQAGASLAVCSTIAALQIPNLSYLTIDLGGNTSAISCANNGDGLATQNIVCGISANSSLICGSTGINWMKHVEIRNGTIGPLYQHVTGTNSGVGSWGISLYGGTNNYFHNLSFNNMERGIQFELGNSIGNSSGNEVSFNTTDAAGTVGDFMYYADSDGGTYTDTNGLLHDNNLTFGYHWDTGAADSVHMESFHIFQYCGAGANDKINNLYIYNNYIHGEFYGDITAAIFISCGATGANANSTLSVYIFNNLIAAGSGTTGPGNGFIYEQDYYHTVSVYNNTIDGYQNNLSYGTCMGFEGNPGTTINLDNNVCMNTKGNIVNDNPTGPTLAAATNDYYNYGTTQWYWRSVNEVTLANWQSATSTDAGSFTTNPGLAATTYIPTSGSSNVVGTGTNLYALNITQLNSDKAGVARPSSGAWTVGAYNYVSSGCTPTSLSFTTQPSAAILGGSLGSVQVSVLCGDGVTVATASSASITLAKAAGSPAGGTVSGTLTQTASSGVATFSGLSVSGATGTYMLTAASSGLTGTTSANFVISACTATYLKFSASPSNAILGGSIGTPSVQVLCADDVTLDVSSAASITVAKGAGSPAGGTLNGTLTATASAGVASFSGLTVTGATGSYTLTATSSGLTSGNSASFTISACTATSLSWSVSPSNAIIGGSLGSPVVQVLCADGITVDTVSSASITVAAASGPAGTLNGTLTRSASGGAATFTGLTITVATGTYTLSAASSGLTGGNSSSFVISACTPTYLSFTTQPTNAIFGGSIGTPTVSVLCADDATVATTSTASITVAKGAGSPAGGTLSGTLTRTASSGVASFAGLSIAGATGTYTLTAASSGLSSGTSANFTISACTATSLSFSTQPSNAILGGNLGSVAVQILCADGVTLDAVATNSITMAIGVGSPAGTLNGTKVVAATAGMATFSTLTVSGATGSSYTLNATSTGLTPVTSTTFTISACTATSLVFSVQPASAVLGASIGTPTVSVLCADGITVDVSSSASVAAAIGTGPGGTLTGTLTQTAASGVAAFPGLAITTVAGSYTLAATSSGLTTANSSSFTISTASTGAAGILLHLKPERRWHMLF